MTRSEYWLGIEFRSAPPQYSYNIDEKLGLPWDAQTYGDWMFLKTLRTRVTHCW